MAAYANYTYYTGTYLGTAIASTDFSRLALRASAEIDRVTFDRAEAVIDADTDTTTIDAIQMATCAVAEELQKDEASGGIDNVTSERQGNWSITYGGKSSAAMTIDEKVEKAAKLYLRKTDLIYRGFAEGEYSGSVSDDD